MHVKRGAMDQRKSFALDVSKRKMIRKGSRVCFVSVRFGQVLFVCHPRFKKRTFLELLKVGISSGGRKGVDRDWMLMSF